MREEISNTLKEYGLSDKEIIIFLYLVHNNRLSAYNIAKATNIFKSTCYDVLERLIEKGFVSKVFENNKTLYSSRNITEIIGVAKSKEELLVSLIPKINNFESTEETNIKHIDSKDSYIVIDTKISELAKKGKLSYVYIIGNAPDLSTFSSKIYVEKLIKELAKLKNIKKINCRGIWDKKYKSDPFMKLFNLLGDNRFLDFLPTNATTIIFDDHLEYLFLNPTPNVIEIKNKKISEEMKYYFELLWKIAKK